MRPRRACSLLLVPLVALLSGCDTVLWLPDSSGIIFPEKEGTRLVRYDLTTKKRTALLPGKKFKTIWPGISADGKKLAIGEMTISTKRGSKERTMKLRIVTYSMGGKELSRSKVHERKDQLDKEAERTEENVEEVFLDWSGPPDKLLLGWSSLGIYDVKKDTIQQVDAEPFGFFPVRRDGKGFLAIDDDKDKSLVLFDWQGKGKKLDFPNFKGPQFKEVTGPAITFWAKGNLQLTTPTKIITLDTDKATASIKALPVTAKRAEEKIKWAHAFPGGEVFLCRIEDDRADYWLEWHRPAKKQVKAVTKPKEYRIEDLQLFPSPDGKFLALSCQNAKEQKRILIIDATGSIRHNIAIEK